jgi:hypothetical protein
MPEALILTDKSRVERQIAKVAQINGLRFRMSGLPNRTVQGSRSHLSLFIMKLK